MFFSQIKPLCQVYVVIVTPHPQHVYIGHVAHQGILQPRMIVMENITISIQMRGKVSMKDI